MERKRVSRRLEVDVKQEKMRGKDSGMNWENRIKRLNETTMRKESRNERKREKERGEKIRRVKEKTVGRAEDGESGLGEGDLEEKE